MCIRDRAGSEGLARGMKVSAPGKTIEVPVGEATLGRMFNVLGQPIDGGEPVPAEVDVYKRQRKDNIPEPMNDAM